MAAAEKFERQMNLLAALLESPRPISAEQIQQRVAGYSTDKDAFRRTFERDKDELRDLGVPVQVATIPATFPEQQGYMVDRTVYEMPELDLASDEIAALRLALQAVRVGDPTAHESESSAALWRLGGLAGGSAVAVEDELAAIPRRPHFDGCRLGTPEVARHEQVAVLGSVPEEHVSRVVRHAARIDGLVLQRPVEVRVLEGQRVLDPRFGSVVKA